VQGPVLTSVIVEQQYDGDILKEGTLKESSLESLSVQIVTSLVVTNFQQIGRKGNLENDQQGW
jgi:hypothetical protein